MANLILAGRIGQEPKTAQYGNTTVATLSLGVSKNTKDKDGRWVSNTLWYEIKAFNKLAESVAKLGKGDLLMIQANLEPSEYKNKEGKVVKTMQITLESFQKLAKAEQKQATRHYHNDTQNLAPQELEPQDGDMPF